MAPPAMKSLLTAFSPTGDYFAICSGDGRIKTWDTIGGLLKGDFADMTASNNSTLGEADGHLAVDYSCMTWNPALKKGKKKLGKPGSSFLLGLGTGSGDVLFLDTALGQLKWRIKDCHAGSVNSLTFAKSGSIMYTAGADGMVCELDVSSGHLLEKFRASKRAISCIAVSGDGLFLAVGSAEIKLFDLSNKKRLCKFTGHPDAVKALVYTDDNQHFLSSANGERHVAVWKNDVTKKGAAASCFLSMEHPAISLYCRGGLSDSLQVLAISEAGVAYTWRASNIEELAKIAPVKINVANSHREASKTLKSSRPAVFAGKLMNKNESGPSLVLVAYGTTVKPLFGRVPLEGQGSIISLPSTENGILLPAVEATLAVESSRIPEAKVLGPDNAVDATKPRTILELDDTPSKPASKKKRRSRADLLPEAATSIDLERLKVSGAEIDELKDLSEMEETMEEKLKALGIIEDGGMEEAEEDLAAPPKADSLLVLMAQALQSDDKYLLEQCLSVNDEKIIGKTIRMLNPVDAAKFLQLSSVNVDSRTKRSLLLVPWIRAVLVSHASYIMSNPSLQPVLNSLYQVIDARLSVFRPLLSLSGRLDLLMAQVSANERSKRGESTAAVIYEESDEDIEQDVEDVMNVDSAEEAEEDERGEEEDEDEDSDNSEDDIGNKNGGLGQKSNNIARIEVSDDDDME